MFKSKFSPSSAVGRSRAMSVEDNTMEMKAAKYDKLMAELKSKVECPVCLTVPTGGQMFACPRGHLVCGPCRAKTANWADPPCPVCREPMGNNKSLLAMVVIENMEHECTNIGCQEKLAFQETTKHRKELCRFRIIICPGNKCEQLLPFSSFDEHAKTCSKSNMRTAQSIIFTLDKEAYRSGNASWNTQIFHLNNETFALRVSLRNNNFSFEPVMLAERDKCNLFTTTISILDPKSVAYLNGQFNPRPIKSTNVEESALVIHKTSLANVFTTNKEDKSKFTIDIKVSEKRTIEET